MVTTWHRMIPRPRRGRARRRHRERRQPRDLRVPARSGGGRPDQADADGVLVLLASRFPSAGNGRQCMLMRTHHRPLIEGSTKPSVRHSKIVDDTVVWCDGLEWFTLCAGAGDAEDRCRYASSRRDARHRACLAPRGRGADVRPGSGPCVAPGEGAAAGEVVAVLGGLGDRRCRCGCSWPSTSRCRRRGKAGGGRAGSGGGADADACADVDLVACEGDRCGQLGLHPLGDELGLAGCGVG